MGDGSVFIRHRTAFEFGRGRALAMDARGPNKATIAKEAARQLEMMHAMFKEEGNYNAGQVRYHANSANNYLKSMIAGGLPVPDWLTRNAGFFRAQDWRW